MIEGVLIVPLKQIPDERGKIMHVLRNDAPHFEKFGEVYCSIIYPGIIKGWHTHSEMTLNYAVPMGTIKLVLYDMRDKSKTKGEIMEIFMGEGNYVLVRIPPGVASAAKGLGVAPSMIVNCSTIPHNQNEIGRMDPFKNDIPYDWSKK